MAERAGAGFGQGGVQGLHHPGELERSQYGRQLGVGRGRHG
jgi:hypothetical protein